MGEKIEVRYAIRTDPPGWRLRFGKQAEGWASPRVDAGDHGAVRRYPHGVNAHTLLARDESRYRGIL